MDLFGDNAEDVGAKADVVRGDIETAVDEDRRLEVARLSRQDFKRILRLWINLLGKVFDEFGSTFV